jgi:hypothetical protein
MKASGSNLGASTGGGGGAGCIASGIGRTVSTKGILAWAGTATSATSGRSIVGSGAVAAAVTGGGCTDAITTCAGSTASKLDNSDSIAGGSDAV